MWLEVNQLLNWEEHISALIKKMSKGIDFYTKENISSSMIHSMYISIIDHISDSTVQCGESAVLLL